MLPIKYLKVKKLVLCFSFYVKLSIILNSLRTLIFSKFCAK